MARRPSALCSLLGVALVFLLFHVAFRGFRVNFCVAVTVRGGGGATCGAMHGAPCGVTCVGVHVTILADEADTLKTSLATNYMCTSGICYPCILNIEHKLFCIGALNFSSRNHATCSISGK